MVSKSQLPPENPFATRAVRPGAIPFIFPPGESAEQIASRLQSARWRGEIIGPHGSGKSTLLATLVPALESLGRRVIVGRLGVGEHRVPRSLLEAKPWNPETLLIVDGYEQLGWCRQRNLIRRCDRAGCGLLATTHQPTGLPVVARLAPTLETARQIVAELLKHAPESISDAQVVHAYERHGEDLRELLFELYDQYEARRRSG